MIDSISAANKVHLSKHKDKAEGRTINNPFINSSEVSQQGNDKEVQKEPDKTVWDDSINQ